MFAGRPIRRPRLAEWRPLFAGPPDLRRRSGWRGRPDHLRSDVPADEAGLRRPPRGDGLRPAIAAHRWPWHREQRVHRGLRVRQRPAQPEWRTRADRPAMVDRPWKDLGEYDFAVCWRAWSFL